MPPSGPYHHSKKRKKKMAVGRAIFSPSNRSSGAKERDRRAMVESEGGRPEGDTRRKGERRREEVVECAARFEIVWRVCFFGSNVRRS